MTGWAGGGVEGGMEVPGGGGEIPTSIIHCHKVYGADMGLYYMSDIVQSVWTTSESPLMV